MRFGTDGIRGLANGELTPELALGLGRAAARVFAPDGGVVLLGRDTRRSGPMLSAAFAAGAASEGADVVDLGVAPTPAVAWASAQRGVAGAVVSASHNPFADNGIKLFAPGGRKLPADLEARIEAELHGSTDARPVGAAVGTLIDGAADTGRWVDAVVATLGGRRLDGLRVVVDAANGAAAAWAAPALAALGADVVAIGDQPDGTNINERCGATHTEALQASVVAEGAQLGIALDGDADRCLAVDAAGQLVDGDQILAVLALDRRARGALAHDTVVVTVMTNLGFRQAMAAEGITVLDTAVGDKHVLAALEDGGHVLGGEQSGHVIQRDLATTGDGLLAGLHLADVVRRSGRPLAELAAVMTRLPQVLRNVRLASRPADLLERVAPQVEAAEAALGTGGRVLLRPSGTEPVVRVMVEAPTAEQASAVAEELAVAVEAAAG